MIDRFAVFPDGSSKPLIWIKDWDFNWQNAYRYKTPIDLPKGTRVDLEYTYDNSEDNPHNPAHPPVRIHWGEQTTDEMALAFLNVVVPNAEDARELRRDVGQQYVQQFLSQVHTLQDLPYEMISPTATDRLTALFKLFDKNGDGQLDDQERAAMMTFVQNFQQRQQQKRDQ